MNAKLKDLGKLIGDMTQDEFMKLIENGKTHDEFMKLIEDNKKHERSECVL